MDAKTEQELMQLREAVVRLEARIKDLEKSQRALSEMTANAVLQTTRF